MITLGFAVLAAIQISLGSCVDNEHVVNPLEAHHQHLNCPHSPELPPPPNPEPCEACCQCEPICSNQPGLRFNDLPDYALPCIRSSTKVGSNPWVYPYGPVLQSEIGNPLCCDPLVPVVRHHVGQHVVDVVKHVPVVRKFCKPELVIRTRHVPIVKHKKRIFYEPFIVHIPVTDKLVRQVIHQYQVKVPVVRKCVKPYTYQTVCHLPASIAKCLPPCPQPCSPNSNPLWNHPCPLGPFPPTACEAPCPPPCDPCPPCSLPLPCPCPQPLPCSCPHPVPCPCPHSVPCTCPQPLPCPCPLPYDQPPCSPCPCKH